MEKIRIGDLFEKAGIDILSALFRLWGYEIKYKKLQAAGTQHGFDIFFRISKGTFPLNIYVECKASESYTTIPAYELIYKSSQLNWAGFTHKDIHIFFSPTVSIKETNQQTGIEDNDCPFIVIDWMRKDLGRNKIMELFYTYEGESEYINKYKKFLSNDENFKSDFISSYSFSAVAEELYQDFCSRIEEYYGQQCNRSFYLFSSSFLDNVKSKTKTKCLPDFYTRTDSNPIRILQVIANDFYIPVEGQFHVANDRTGLKSKKSIGEIINDVIDNTPALIKILARGGEGKSTFLYHIARLFFDRFNVIYMEKFREKVIKEIAETLRRLKKDLPLLLLLDNAEKHEDDLIENVGRLINNLYDYKLIFILAERDFRYHQIENVRDFERYFDERHTMEFITPDQDKKEIFNKLFSFLIIGSCDITERDRTVCQELYLDTRKSVVESTFKVVEYLKANNKIDYEFDWVDWRNFINRNPRFSGLQNLYLELATYYQFGISIRDNFFANKDINIRIKINEVLKDNINLPIYKQEDDLYLRHESIARWYFEEKEEEKGKARQRNARLLFEEFLKNINNEERKRVLIKIYRKNEFQASFLKDLVDYQKVADILENYIRSHPGEIKGRTELGKIYQLQERSYEAEKVLKNVIEIEKNSVHAQTELGRIFQKLEQWGKAESVFNEIIKIDKNDVHSRTELGRVYQKLDRWEDAERVLKEAIEIEKNSVHARTELGRIYQKKEQWSKAISVFNEIIKIDKNDVHSRTELGRVYQRLKKWEDAEKVLKEVVEINKYDIHCRTELGRVYQKMGKLEDAEKVLKEAIELDINDVHPRTVLGIVYQKLERWEEAERVLREVVDIDRNDVYPRTELGRVYQRLEKWEDAEKVLKEAIEIDKDHVHSRTELGIVYQKLEKWQEAERVLKEAIEIDRNDVHPRTVLSRVYQKLEKWEEADEIFALMPENKIDDIAKTDWAITKIKLMESSQDEKDKEFYYRQAYGLLNSINIKDEFVMKKLAFLAELKGDYNGKMEILHEACEKFPGNLYLLQDLASEYDRRMFSEHDSDKRLQYFEEAQKIYEEIFKSGVGDKRALLKYMKILKNYVSDRRINIDYRSKIILFEAQSKKLLEYNIDNSVVHSICGDTLRFIKPMQKDAEFHFKEAIRLNRKNWQAHVSYGAFLYIANREAEAQEHFDLAYRYVPENKRKEIDKRIESAKNRKTKRRRKTNINK